MEEIVEFRSIVSLNRFKAKAARCLEQPAEEGRPLLITRNGVPAAVLLAPATVSR